MPLVTLTKVADDHRTFETQNGKFAVFKVWAGEDVGEVVTKADTLEKRLAQFREIVGKPTELVVEDQGSFPHGSPKPKRIKFPQQGQGKRDYVPRWTDTEEGFRAADDSLNRRRALELAVSLFADKPTGWDAVVPLAEKFVSFLIGKASEELEPGSTVAGSPQSGMGETDSGEATNTGASSDGAGADGEAAPAPTPSEEQADQYIRTLREGPGVTQAVLQARVLFETQVRKIPNLRVLSADELLQVVQAFADKREDVPA
jgi:hypothetical protein